jgi:serine/threonine-protein kinase
MFRRVGLSAIAGTAVAVALLALTVPASAAAEARAPEAVLKNVATGFCLDSNANKQAYTHDCNGGSYQKWTLGRGSHGTTLKNLATGFCLDSNANKQLYTHDCNGGSYQQWNGI